MDTDMQFAYCAGIRDYMLKKKDYVSTAVGNPDGDDKPNKKYFDVRRPPKPPLVRSKLADYFLAPCLGPRG